ncbi:unnamed protein product, partial [Tilletia laevis]
TRRQLQDLGAAVSAAEDEGPPCDDDVQHDLDGVEYFSHWTFAPDVNEQHASAPNIDAALPTGYRSTYEGLLHQQPSEDDIPAGNNSLGRDVPEDGNNENSSERAIDAFLQAFKLIGQSDVRDWAPFPDRETFLVAVASLNPRSPLSVSEIKTMLSFAHAVGGERVPSYDTYLKALKSLRQLSSGLEQRKGSSGNLFYITPLHDIISRQFSN